MMDQETAPVAEGTEQSVRNIFEYSNILIYWSQIFIRTFVRVNFSIQIFSDIHLCSFFMSIYSNIRLVFTLNHTHERISEYIRTNKFIQRNVRIYS